MKKDKLLLLGLSTGGPSHIKKILSSFKTLNCHIVIAQHMKEDVISFFIDDMKQSFPHNIEASPYNFSPQKSIIFCSKTAEFMTNTKAQISLEHSPNSGYYTPDVNTLFKSALSIKNSFEITAVLLTGIGADGAESLKVLKDNNIYTIAESQTSAPVYGMPRVAYDIGATCAVMRVDELIAYLKKEHYVAD